MKVFGAVIAAVLLCWVSPSARAADEPRITLQLNDISVSEALRKVFTQAGVRAVIDGEVTGNIQALSLNDVPLKTAVRTLARYADADFEVKDGVYLVKPKAVDPPKVDQPAPVGPPPPFPTAEPERAVVKERPAEPERVNTVKFVERKTAPGSFVRRAVVTSPAVSSTRQMGRPTYVNQPNRTADYARARMMYRPPAMKMPKSFKSARQIARTNAALRYYYKHKAK